MDRAIELASRGARRVLPNPCVGAVIARNDAIIGEGYHERFGGPHAEVHAIQSVSNRELLRDSTLYVTLEPCAHFGKTPPCADLIMTSKIPRVVVGCRDPFPAVSGRGIQRLIEAGVEVIEDIRHDECALINKRFILAHTQQRPYIILKWAETSDGFIAPEGGARTTISSRHSHQLTHLWRGQEMAIAVGSRTARGDNPLLTIRHTDLFPAIDLPAPNPVRVIIGESSHIPHDLEMFYAAGETVVFTAKVPCETSLPSSVSVVKVSGSKPLVPQVCRHLYQRSIISLLVEGGSTTLQNFIDADLWDEARVFTAPIEFGSGIAAPKLPVAARETINCGGDVLRSYTHPDIKHRIGLYE